MDNMEFTLRHTDDGHLELVTPDEVAKKVMGIFVYNSPHGRSQITFQLANGGTVLLSYKVP